MVYLLTALRLFWIISRYAVNVFYWAQWEFNDATLFQQHSLWQIFRWQYGPHRQGLGGVISKLIEPEMHWSCRSEAFVIGGIIFLASILALYLKVRLYGSIRYEDAIIPLLFLTPVQYESMIGTQNFSHPALPLLLVILYCISWTIASYPRKYLSVLLINFLAIYTGFGIFVGFLTPELIILDYFRNVRHRPPRYRAWSGLAALISIISLFSFFVDYKWWPSVDCSLRMRHPVVYFVFVDVMFATFLGVKVSKLLIPAILLGGFTLIAAIILMGVFVKKLFTKNGFGLTRLVVISILLAYCLIFCLNTAAGRICLGIGAAQGSRYASYVVLGFFAFYLGALSVRRRMWRIACLSLTLILTLMSSARINTVDRLSMQEYSQERRAWRECYLTHHDIQQCDLLSHFQVLPWSNLTELKEKRLQEKLDFLERNRLNLFSDRRSDQ